MFEAIELLINDLFERHIENYEDFEKKIYWTSPDRRNGYKTTIDRVLSSYENYEGDVSYLKDCILQTIFLLNDSGIQIFLDKFKERLDYISEENERDRIKIQIFRGRRIKPLKESILREYFYPDPSNYQTETLEFELKNIAQNF